MLYHFLYPFFVRDMWGFGLVRAFIRTKRVLVEGRMMGRRV